MVEGTSVRVVSERNGSSKLRSIADWSVAGKLCWLKGFRDFLGDFAVFRRLRHALESSPMILVGSSARQLTLLLWTF